MTDTQQPETQPDAQPVEQPVVEAQPIEVFYVFAGANLGGESLFLCTTCGALLQEPLQDTHTVWHRNGPV